MLDAIQNELQYRFGTKGANEGTVRKGPDGQYNIGIMGRALGVTPEMMETAGNNYDRRNFAQTQLGQEADTYGLLPETGGTPNKQSLRKKIGDAKTREALGQKIKMLGGKVGDVTDLGVLAEMADTLDTERSNSKTINSPTWQRTEERYLDEKASDRLDRQEARNQLDFTRRENALDRRQTQDLAILSGDHQMQIQQMNAELADKRMAYDRETRSMDKRDRMIAQLMSGLGALGGAF